MTWKASTWANEAILEVTLADWSIRPGEIVTRAEVAELYGGARFGGIQPSRTSANVFVYSDRAAGEKNGYLFDGWSPEEDDVFYYTGEGQVGNQTMDKGNLAILRHHDDRRAMRLFATLEDSTKGAKHHRYVGEFVVDSELPYRIERAPDRDGKLRDVFVFRLLALNDQRFEDDVAAATMSEHLSLLEKLELVTDAAPVSSGLAVDIVFVDPERHNVMEFAKPPISGQTATKREAALVQTWEHHLRAIGHEVGRARIPIPGEREIVTDTLDKTSSILFEAKSSADRSTVRLAIGQLFDYRRFLPEFRPSVLLPKPPSVDVGNLIESCDFGLVFRERGAWRSPNLDEYN